jgi:nucleotide-binding universal stress UspA family protein
MLGRSYASPTAQASSLTRPQREESEDVMYKNILIPTDGSELAGKAVEHGVMLAKENGARITAVFVTEPFHVLSVALEQLEYTRSEYQKHADAVAEKALGAVATAAKHADVACETLHLENDNVYQGIIEAAASRGCDLIVIASHGRHGLSAVVLGSVTVKVLTHSKIPVLVYR